MNHFHDSYDDDQLQSKLSWLRQAGRGGFHDELYIHARLHPFSTALLVISATATIYAVASFATMFYADFTIGMTTAVASLAAAFAIEHIESLRAGRRVKLGVRVVEMKAYRDQVWARRDADVRRPGASPGKPTVENPSRVIRTRLRLSRNHPPDSAFRLLGRPTVDPHRRRMEKTTNDNRNRSHPSRARTPREGDRKMIHDYCLPRIRRHRASTSQNFRHQDSLELTMVDEPRITYYPQPVR